MKRIQTSLQHLIGDISERSVDRVIQAMAEKNIHLPEVQKLELKQRVRDNLGRQMDQEKISQMILKEVVRRRNKQGATLNRDPIDKAREAFHTCISLMTPVLKDSINKTFLNIAQSIEKTFFERILSADKKLKAEPERWSEVLHNLRKAELFEEIDDFDLMGIAEAVEERKFKARQPFFTIGSPANGFFISIERIAIQMDDGFNSILGYDQIFGERAYADDKSGASDDSFFTHQDSVAPLENCTVYFIPREKYNIIPKIPGLEQKIFRKILFDARQDRIIAREQTKRTTEILDHIGRGWISINEQGEIGEHADVVKKYLGSKNLTGVSFADKAFSHNPKALRNYYRALFTLFNEDHYDSDMIIQLLPNEVTLNKSTFELYYSFVEDDEGGVLSVFIQMNDVTQQRKLERQGIKDKRIREKMNENIGGFLDMVREVDKTNHLLDQFGEHFVETQKEPQKEDYNELLRILHSTKGLLGAFCFDDMKSLIHEFETSLLAMKSEGVVKKSGNYFELMMQLQTDYTHAIAFKENLGGDIIQRFHGINYSQDEQAQLEQALEVKDLETLHHIILNKTKISARQVIQGWDRDIHLLAEELGKKVEFHPKIEERLLIPVEIAKELNNILRHIYRNSLDHGIETPEERKALNKKEVGVIVIDLEAFGEMLIIKIKDDGTGLDLPKLRSLAKANDQLDQALVDRYIRQGEEWRVLFMSGFSSKQEVTKLSGRGVGLNAVLHSVEDRGGSISIQSTLHKGTNFKLKIPLKSLN